MKIILLAAVSVMSLTLALPEPVNAREVTNWRCGGKLVRPGDTKYNVRKKCGMPVYKDRHESDKYNNYFEWVYETRKTVITLWFNGSELVKIEQGSK